MQRLYRPIYLLIFLALTIWQLGNAQVYPANFAQVLVSGGLTNPTALAFAPDGRIFVALQAGKLKVIKNNVLLPTDALQLTVNSTGERGLIGMAFDPDFASNNFIYLYYTVPAPLHNRVSRFTVNGDVVIPTSEVVVLELDPLSTATNHNGGAMHFGKDDKLYIAVGENATPANAQNENTYHGKLLRVNSDGSVPAGNPFTTGSEQRKRIWALGLRNPYTFDVHPVTGRILVNDVGQVTWEEVNDATTGGKNFGWPTTEGNFNQTTYPNLTNPIYTYGHGNADGVGCAITGGIFYNPVTSNYPSSYFGKYFIQDLCSRWINSLDISGSTATRSSFATAIAGNALALTTGADGNLYFLSRSTNSLYKIVYSQSTSPFITSHPVDATIAEGQSVTFSVNALGTTPFSYQWKKDDVNISGATSSTFTINGANQDDAGEYWVEVSNTAGMAISNAASLLIITNELPVATVVTPAEGSTYAGGTEINFSGTGQDPEDGALSPAAFKWEISFHHNTHKHDEPPREGITGGSFTIPTQGETSDNVWYSIILTVTDSKGFTGKDSVHIDPRKSVITIQTVPPGLEVTIDGQPFTAPVDLTSVEGIERNFGVTTPQFLEDAEYEFASWSNGGEAIQTIPTPADDLTLVATFSSIVGIEENAPDNGIILYPNPTNEEFITIKISIERQQDVSIQLMDLLAKEMGTMKRQLSPGEHSIPFYVGKKRSGIYSIVINTGEQTVVKKVAIIE